MGRWLLAGILTAALIGRPACAAQFKTVALPDGGGTAILMTGLIENGDDLAFHNLANTLASAVVITTGPGGRVGAALNIGNETRARGWTTLVPAGESCASACSMIWLAGVRRMLGHDAQIGFHAMSMVQDGRLQETHTGDEVLRRWLTDLGYALDATATIVNTRAVSVRWFDAIELRANGIPTDDYP
jgi:hypothetical protein